MMSQPSSGSSLLPNFSKDAVVLGHIKGELGRRPSRPSCLGDLVTGSKMPSHQSGRDVGCFISPSAFQDRLIGYTVELMSYNTSVVTSINRQVGTVSSFLYLLSRQVLAWADKKIFKLSGLPNTRSSEFSNRSAKSSRFSGRDGVISSYPGC